MNDAELLQQLASLNWIIRTGENASQSGATNSSTSGSDCNQARDVFALIAGARVVDELYQRITKKREIEQAWASVVLRVADYVKAHPRATEGQLVDFVRSELKTFEEYVNAL